MATRFEREKGGKKTTNANYDDEVVALVEVYSRPFNCAFAASLRSLAVSPASHYNSQIFPFRFKNKEVEHAGFSLEKVRGQSRWCLIIFPSSVMLSDCNTADDLQASLFDCIRKYYIHIS